MAFKLRPYQQAAVDAAIKHMKKCVDPALIEAATGAGKSLIVSEVARWINEKSGKKVLCLAPSRELVEQNADKYREYGLKASLWSASVGKKEMLNDVVFGTPMSVLNDIQHFGSQFAGIVIDEAHGISPTIIKIVLAMKDANPKTRIIGLTATPYRLGSGYIYSVDDEGNPVGEEATKNPFFIRLLYRITAKELIDQGYLTKPVCDAEIASKYDTSSLVLKKNGQFDSQEVERTFEGKGRLTADIVADVVANSAGKLGVMFFAATRQHGKEIMESLPKDNARFVTGETNKKEREQIIKDFKAMRFKYLVNVSVLTTGFDAPHVDVIAILRATESAGLLQQIIGRGLRLHESKATCLVLDYAGNIERHKLEDDLFSPDIKVSGGGSSESQIEAVCELCGTTNRFSARKNPDGFESDENGYFLDLSGDRVDVDGQPMPSHYGRRCNGRHYNSEGHDEQCSYRWSFKVCPECETENDIAARYCANCREELVDPNTSLMLQYKKIKEDPRILSTDRVITWSAQPWISQSGKTSLRVDYTTDYRTFPVWYSPDSKSNKIRGLWNNLSECVFGKGHIAPTVEMFMSALKQGHGKQIETVTCKKEGDFFRVFAHNLPEEESPDGIM